MYLNECTSSGYFFQEVRLTEEEYSTRQSTHKTKLLHQHRIPLRQEESADRSSRILEPLGSTINQIWSHYLWKQDHSSKGDESQDVAVHPRGTSG